MHVLPVRIELGSPSAVQVVHVIVLRDVMRRGLAPRCAHRTHMGAWLVKKLRLIVGAGHSVINRVDLFAIISSLTHDILMPHTDLELLPEAIQGPSSVRTSLFDLLVHVGMCHLRELYGFVHMLLRHHDSVDEVPHGTVPALLNDCSDQEGSETLEDTVVHLGHVGHHDYVLCTTDVVQQRPFL